MLRVFRPGIGEETVIDAAVPGAALSPDAMWIDLFEPTREEEVLVETTLGFQVPTREEMAEIEPSSRFYQEGGSVFLTANVMSGIDAGDPVSTPVSFVLAPRHLVTVRYADPRPFRSFATHIGQSPMMCGTAPMTLIGLLDAIVDRLADTLEVVQADIDRTSRAVFRRDKVGGRRRARMSNAMLHELMLRIGDDQDLLAKTRDSLNSMGRLMRYLALPAFIREDGELREHVKGLGRDVTSLIEHSAFLSTNISFMLDASLGLINIEQNAIIKIFSVAAVIFLPPTLVASIYGMNFDHMPELRWLLGYPYALAMMAMSAVLPYLFFKRKGWL
ncbi:magnesium transporter CorA family protein [Sphingoaurantiacus capsulatus]|uniref:Magnesium transporter CorA family protein n=1 Tax=Sphingoaurantiacus capsulatus TaxID=1771310 RepID=A0ABV7XGG1_9SPHN